MALTFQPSSYEKLVQTQSHAEAALQIIQSIDQGRCCRALGPRDSAKSRLMLQVRDKLLKRSYYNVAYQSLLRLEQHNEAFLFSTIYQTLCTSIGYKPPKDVRIRTDSDFKIEVLQLLRMTHKHVVLIIDDVEMAMLNLVASLLRTIRAIYMTSVDDSPFASFRAVVCGAYVSNEVLMKAHYSGFERVSDLVLIGDFDDAERLEYAKLIWSGYGYPLADDALPRLFQYTGGDAFLLKHILRECRQLIDAENPHPLNAFDVNRAVNHLIARPTQAITRALKMVEGSPELLEAALEILQHGEVPRSELRLSERELPNPNQLDLTGVFVQTLDYRYKVKCSLWTKLLHSHFTPVHIGSLFATSGRWERSLYSLNHAMQAGDDQAKARMFTTVINAIYTSNSLSMAFAYLGRGFESLYPSTSVALYQQQDDLLTPVYPRPRSSQERRNKEIFLHEDDEPEISALQGTPYTYHAESERLFIPLRYQSVTNRTVGLAVIHFEQQQKLSYDQLSEMPQVLSFVSIACEALDRLNQMLQELTFNKETARQLKTINRILSKILPMDEPTHTEIYRLMLAGVTANLGLEFNRAILFVPDGNNPRLKVGYAVGQLTYREAKREWSRSTYKNFDALIRDVQHRHKNGVASPLETATAKLMLPVDKRSNDPIVRAFQTRKPELIRHERGELMRRYGLGKLNADFVHQIDPASNYAIVPLSSGTTVRGVLYVDDRFLQRTISEERFELLITFVSQIALIIEIKDEANRQRERRKIVADISAQITEKVVDDLDEIYRIALELIKKAVPKADHACIVELKNDNELVIPLVCRDFYQIDEQSDWQADGCHKSIIPKLGIAGRVIKEGVAVLSPNVRENPDYIAAIRTTQSQVCVPVRAKNTHAALVLESDLLNAFNDDDRHFLETLAGNIAVAIHSAELYRQAESNAQSDHLVHMAKLATGLVHDVNNAVGGVTDKIRRIKTLLARENVQNSEIIQLLTTINEQIDEVDSIGVDLRDYLVTKRLRLDYIALETLIQQAIKKVEALKPHHIHGIQVKTIRQRSTRPIVYVDGNWIQLVLKNLLSNAFKAIPKDRDGTIVISYEERDDDVMVYVYDNGSGISPNDWKKVFEPGYTTNQDHRGMHGIGLFHCKLVIAEHQGKLDIVESRVGIGTTFAFNLPKHPWKDSTE